ncbi:MAG: DUF4129 domain-containing protein [Kaistella sp.]
MKFKILFFLLFFFLFGFSQDLTVPPQSQKADSLFSLKSGDNADSLLDLDYKTNNIIYPKNFQEKFRSKYKSPDFDYTTTKPTESLFQKLQKRIVKILEAIFGQIDSLKGATYAVYILRFFAIVLGALFLYFLIRFLLNKNGNFFFGKKNQKFDIANQDIQENIHAINFPQTIENYESQKDFRSAIRYRFLFILKKLSDKNLLNWNPEKTNKDYLAELKNSSLKENFSELVYIFDYVWYGEFEVTEVDYAYFKEKFLNFKM